MQPEGKSFVISMGLFKLGATSLPEKPPTGWVVVTVRTRGCVEETSGCGESGLLY